MTKIYIFIAVIFAMAIILKIFFDKPDKLEEGTYEKRNILTEAEQKFYNELKTIVADRYYIFPQIHLANLLTVKAHPKIWKSLFNKIIQKSVDFALVDKITFETKLVIELDDYTHTRKNRIDRDGFVDKSLKSAGIAIIHVKEHNLNELNNYLADNHQG